MRHTFLLLLSVCAVAGSSLFAGTADDAVLETVDHYTVALQGGDVAALKELLGGRLYLKRRTLLESNSEYPSWLRDYYAGAQFSFSLSAVGNERYPDGKLVDVTIVLRGGETAKAKLVVEYVTDAGWKIIDRI